MEPKLLTYNLHSTSVAFPKEVIFSFCLNEHITFQIFIPKWFVGVALLSYRLNSESRMFNAFVCSLVEIKLANYS